jgi:hypothetical protein
MGHTLNEVVGYAFQCLQHTVGLETGKWRLLSECHNLRNQAEYEGMLNLSSRLVDELITITQESHTTVKAMGPVDESTASPVARLMLF